MRLKAHADSSTTVKTCDFQMGDAVHFKSKDGRKGTPPFDVFDGGSLEENYRKGAQGWQLSLKNNLTFQEVLLPRL